jgi:hypothetical protein
MALLISNRISFTCKRPSSLIGFIFDYHLKSIYDLSSDLMDEDFLQYCIIKQIGESWYTRPVDRVSVDFQTATMFTS